MTIPYITGLPGVGTPRVAKPSIVFRDGSLKFALSGGRQIDGTKVYDYGNTGDADSLRPGMVMGKISASGLYAPSILGPTGAVYSGGTSLTLSAVTQQTVTSRIGSSGTVKIVGPTSANGNPNTETVTFSALNTSTNVMTISALSNNYVNGALILPNDGSDDPKSIIPDGYPMKVTDLDGVNRITIPWWNFPIEGVIISTNILFWPADTGIQDWLIGALSQLGEAKFIFDSRF
jgi:hypothetical protein